MSFAVNLLVACAPKAPSSGSAAQVDTSAPTAQQPAPQSRSVQPIKAQGTSDSGGCNGVENKCFDSYIIDPTTLPAYKNIVKPLLENIKSSDPLKPSTNSTGNAFKIKLWYLAPVDLESLKKEALGVSFVKSEIQQIAIQSMKAIWIDKRIFDKMSEKDQAELLIHELIMSMYFIRFMTLNEICNISLMLWGKEGNEGCVNPPEYFTKSMPAEKLRPLTEEDNERIRFATAWLLQSAQNPIQEVDFIRILKFQGFDKRFFNPDNYGSKKDLPPDLKISKKEMMDAIKASQLTGFIPEICTDGETSAQCKIDFSETEIKYQSFSIPALNLKITKNEEELASVVGMFSQEITLTASSDSNGQIIYNYTTTEWRNSVDLGNKVSTAIILFKYNGDDKQKQLMLESIVVIKGVIVSIDKKRDPICVAASPKAKAPFGAGFIMHKESNDTLVTEQMFFAIKPVALCTQENVK